MKKIIFLFCFSMNIFCSLKGQPYHYYLDIPGNESQYNGSRYSYIEVNRFNFYSNNSDTIFENYGRINQILSNPTQDILLIQKRKELEILLISTSDSKSYIFPESEWVNFTLDAPKLNRFYLIVGDPGFPNKIVVLDRQDFSVLDTIPSFRDYYLGLFPFDKYFLSSNQRVIYDRKIDSSGFYFKIYDSISGNILNDSFKCGKSGPFAFGPSLEYGKSGKAIFGWEFASGFLHQNYTICDVDNNIEGPTISFPWRSRAYLSPSFEEIIIERVDWVTGLPFGDNPNLHLGDIYIFDAKSGLLKNYYNFPDSGRVHIFDTHPNIAYYLIEGESLRSYSINLTNQITNLSFTDTLETFRFRSCEELDWATDATVCRELADDLSEVKANLQAGDSLSAANALSNFIELVEQEKGESLTSEGYALLYFNAEYLAERLPEPRIKR